MQKKIQTCTINIIIEIIKMKENNFSLSNNIE